MIRLLGPVSVDNGTGSSIRLGGRVPSSVLVFLTLAEGRTVTVDGLIDQIWDDPQAAARNAVQVAVSKLRKSLGAALISGGRDGYRLRTDLVVVDLFSAQQYASQARAALFSGQAKAAAEAAGLALDLFTGVPLGGLESQAAATARQSVVDLRRDLVFCRAEAFLMLGQPGEAVSGLRPLVAADPFSEAAVALLMDAMLASGRASDALEVYEQLRNRLVDELGLDPSPVVVEAHQRALNNRPRHPAAIHGLAGALKRPSLPAQEVPVAASPIFGRDDETRDILALFEGGQRLVALTGPGGIGKTRLALAIADAAARQAGRPVSFVDLTVCTAPAMVHDTVQATIDPDRLGFRTALADSAALIVLDNAEHVLDGVVTVAGQLLQEPTVTVLVTSQRPLRLRDACNIALGPLDISAPNSPAGRLLAHRVGRRDGAAEDLKALIRVTDGHPLTLELVAAALEWTTAEQLATGLTAHIDDLQADTFDRPGRHGSLAAAMSWSIADCSQEARAALGALAVFRGPFPKEAADAVVSASLDAPNTRPVLAELLDHCLLGRLPEPRQILFRLLEPVRLAVLADALVPPASQAARRAHAQYYFDTMRELDRLDDTDALGSAMWRSGFNIHHALDWAWEHDRASLTPALGSILRAWYTSDEHAAVLDWSDRLLSSTEGSDGERDRVAFMRALTLLWLGGAEPRPAAALPASLDLTSESWNDGWYRLWIVYQVEHAVQRGDLQRAISWLDRSRLRSPADRAGAAYSRGYLYSLQGEYDLAAEALEAGLIDASEGTNHRVGLLAALGYLETVRGNYQQSRRYLYEASRTVKTSDARSYAQTVDQNLAWLELESGHDQQAIQRITDLVMQTAGPMDVYSMTELTIIAGLAAVRLGRRPSAHELTGQALACAEASRIRDPFVASRLQDLAARTGATRADVTPTTERLAATLHRLVDR